MQPYYKDELVTIYHGDCRELELPPIDLIITDPPYGVNHPTDFHARGRGKVAVCSDYAPVHDDNKPFDPSISANLSPSPDKPTPSKIAKQPTKNRTPRTTDYSECALTRFSERETF